MTEELLAQLIEEVSVLAANYRRDKPRQVTRPGSVDGPNGEPGTSRNGLNQLLNAAVSRGAVRHV